MPKHPPSRKKDYRHVLSERSPDHQIAIMKLFTFFAFLVIVVLYLFKH